MIQIIQEYVFALHLKSANLLPTFYRLGRSLGTKILAAKDQESR